MLKILGGALTALLMSSTLTLAGPLQAYGQLPAMSDVEISGDGATLAYIEHIGASARVVIQPLDGGAPQTVDFGKVKVRGIS